MNLKNLFDMQKELDTKIVEQEFWTDELEKGDKEIQRWLRVNG